MNKKHFITALALSVALGAGAQTAYDAAKITSTDLNGTARFVGMGGAMGALGGDLSTIGTNPAGLGIFRSNDVSMSFGFSNIGTESNYMGHKLSNNKTRFSFDNMGFVVSHHVGNHTALRFVNFGFNYCRAKSFYRNTLMSGELPFSQTDLMSTQANNMFLDAYNPVDLWQLRQDKINPYDDNRVGWLGSLGFDAGLVETADDIDPPYSNPHAQPLANYKGIERGGINQYDFNVSFNLQDRVYLGLSIGLYDVDYRKTYFYQEDLGAGDSYDLSSWNDIEGIGWNVKLGAFVRPFEDSPLRIGFAVHSPTIYSLSYHTSAIMHSKLWYVNTETQQEFLEEKKIDTFYELYDSDMKTDFDFHTPWKYNVSLGYTVGSSLALGAEYEFEDYGKNKFFYPDYDGEEMYFENDQIKQVNKGVHTFRAGAEYKVIPQFAFRFGYNYSSTAFEKDALKVLPTNSLHVDTDFANTQSLSNYTIGVGYRSGSVYLDLAYKYSTQKSDFYPFAFSDDRPQVTKLTDTRSQVLLTLGWRF